MSAAAGRPWSGWGRYPRARAAAVEPATEEELRARLAEPGDAIPRGLGRSYGDSALAPRLLLSSGFRHLLAFDPASGELTCEAGVSLGELVDIFLPRGWFPPVVPGTRHVTVGGAIAADIHGKNHHRAGAFGRWVRRLDLMLPDGRVVTCDRQRDAELFRATLGGMGLTGVILRATIELRPVPGGWMRQRALRAANLGEALALFDEHRTATYSVAWIDCLARGRRQGRSVLWLGEHDPEGGPPPRRPRRPGVPFDAPGFLLNRASVSLFNALYFRAARRGGERRVGVESFFFPLDAVAGWNRLYGRRGFTQYQLVLPREAGAAGLSEILDRVARSGRGSFLAVLKLLGPAGEGPLSFPLEGYTLALDFKIERRLFPLLDELDRVVLDHGGRLYLAKDARMPPTVFQRGYPGEEGFRDLRERLGLKAKLNSLQARRLGI